MRFQPTPLAGAYVIELEPNADERGSFARIWCRDEFLRHGLNPDLAQCSTSFNRKRGTLRGLHFQAEPHGEAKLVRCTRGRIYDVIVDLRPDSRSFRKWFAVELWPDSNTSVYVPEGFAHGFQTLEDDSEVLYMISAPYAPDAARGVRWNDPALGIRWPLPDPILSARDREFPLLG